ncbi:YolD-like family protein [Kroppenstedtia pulmonis]|uniref:YolD-like family protein n=1 Tax=Kroppenstedtia pulmonis TaxID=1380685 RepID=A0A7D3Y204_9BACL|nr:YolD-like family protein [Kroppenstedtia pulmonis]
MERGNKLWEGHRMILPEHVDRYQKSRRKRYVAPIPDEQQMEEWNRIIQDGKQTGQRLRWQVFNEEGTYWIEGRVGRIRPEEGWLEVVTERGNVRIEIKHLLDIQLL